MGIREDIGIDALIFDLNGVLFEGRELHDKALYHSIAHHGYDVPMSLIKMLNGWTTEDKLDALVKFGHIPRGVDIKKIAKTKRDLAFEMIRNTPIRENIRDAISHADYLMPVGVATNSDGDTAEAMIEAAGISQFVSVIVSAHDFDKFTPKPSPMVYAVAAHKLGTSPDKCLAFDDTDRGIMSAIDAGCKTIRIDSLDTLSIEFIDNVLDSMRIRI